MYLVRTAYGFDTAAATSRLSTKKVTTNRFGIEGLWKAGPKFKLWGDHYNSALLAFYFNESIAISDSRALNETDADEEISEVKLLFGFVGIGLAISW